MLLVAQLPMFQQAQVQQMLLPSQTLKAVQITVLFQ